MRTTTRSMARLTAALAAVALVATGCSSGGDEATSGESGAASGEPVTLTLATFNEFGYEELIKEYETLNPNVTIEHKKAATSNEARDNLNTRLAADIALVEDDHRQPLRRGIDRRRQPGRAAFRKGVNTR